MAKFSLDNRDEDGEGPSTSARKRLRISIQSDFVHGGNQEQFEEEEEGNERDEDEGDDDIYEEEEYSEGEASEEEENYEEEAQRCQEDSFVSAGPRSNVGGQLCRDGSIAVTLTDPEVLDCTICYEPLSSPVFQCENGHVACSSCCIKLLNKCPSCFWPIGYNRCRSIEKVLEAIKISCPNTRYGCKEAVSYSKKNEHRKRCMYAPCSCPLSNCSFIDSSKHLYLHFSKKHPSSAIGFRYDSMFSISLNVDDKFTMLREQCEGVLFVLYNSAEHIGNIAAISCIGPCSSARGFIYTLLARAHGDSLRLHSLTKNVQHRVDDPPSSACFLLIPSDFFVSGQLKLDVRIQQNAPLPPPPPAAAAAAAAATCDQRIIGSI